jgi:hypothetical protein
MYLIKKNNPNEEEEVEYVGDLERNRLFRRQCTITSHVSLLRCGYPRLGGPTLLRPEATLPHALCSICGVCYDCSEMKAALK